MASLRDTVKELSRRITGRYRLGGVLENGTFLERTNISTLNWAIIFTRRTEAAWKKLSRLTLPPL